MPRGSAPRCPASAIERGLTLAAHSSDLSRIAPLLVAVLVALGLDGGAQSRPSRSSAPPAKEVTMTCPAQLGTGARTGRVFCDVLIVSEPAGGVMLQLP